MLISNKSVLNIKLDVFAASFGIVTITSSGLNAYSSATFNEIFANCQNPLFTTNRNPALPLRGTVKLNCLFGKYPALPVVVIEPIF